MDISTTTVRLELAGKLLRRGARRQVLRDRAPAIAWPVVLLLAGAASVGLVVLLAWILQTPPQVPLNQPLFW